MGEAISAITFDIDKKLFSKERIRNWRIRHCPAHNINQRRFGRGSRRATKGNFCSDAAWGDEVEVHDNF
jgi:hypothetical protein